MNDIIVNVMNMWINELNRIKILKGYSLIELEEFKIPRRTKKSDNLNSTVLKDIRFGCALRFQKYNYQKRIIEPIDLTGHRISQKFYKMDTICTIIIEGDNGEELNIEIKIEEDEIKKLKKLTDKEKMIFVLEIAKKQGRL